MYTDGSCKFPSATGFRFTSYAIVLDSCLSDDERITAAREYKLHGTFPPSLHLISHAMGSGAQTIHRAELLALVRVMEEFAGIIVHVDSASALRAWEKAVSWLPEDLHPLRDLDLILRLRSIPHLGCNLAVKVKAHLDPGALPDLECYHALGNALADKGASDALQLIPSLAQDWSSAYHEFEEEMSLLRGWMEYLVALQPVRTRLSHGLEVEGQPVMAHESVLEKQRIFRSWAPDPCWTPEPLTDANPVFWEYGTWGEDLTSRVARWLGCIQWPMNELDTFPCNVGMSWLEVCLSLLLWLGCFIPVRRRWGEDDFRLFSFGSFAEAVAEGLTLSELSLQSSTLISQVNALAVVPLIPSWVKRSRIKSLYYQGFSMHAYGWSCRPLLPNQPCVQKVIEKLRELRPHATSWSWLPVEIFGDFGVADFRLGDVQWRLRQQRLQAGLKEVRLLQKLK